MHPRRLIVAPVVAFIATGLVAAVIDTGQRTRAEAMRAPSSVQVDEAMADELRRIDDARRAEHACVGAWDCDVRRAGTRLRSASERVRTWPPDPQFREVRRRLVVELQARATLLDQLSMNTVDGRTSPVEHDRTEQLHEAWVRAARSETDAQLAAGLIDRMDHARTIVRLGRSEP